MQHTAVYLLKMSWAPSNSRNFMQQSHHSFRSVLLSLWKKLISSWHQVSTTAPSHRQESKQGRPLQVSSNGWGKKSNSRRKPSVTFWLLTPTWNQVLRLAMVKMGLRKKRNNNNSKPQQKTNHRPQQVAEDYQPGVTSGQEHKYSSFCQSNKRCEKR